MDRKGLNRFSMYCTNSIMSMGQLETQQPYDGTTFHDSEVVMNASTELCLIQVSYVFLIQYSLFLIGQIMQ